VVIAFQIWTLLGVAVVTYVLLWIFVPLEDVGVSLAGRLTRRFPRIGPAIGLLLLLAGAAAVAAQLEAWLVWPVLLIGGGILLYRDDAGRATPTHAHAQAPTGSSLRLPPPPPRHHRSLARRGHLASAHRSAGSAWASRSWSSAAWRSCRTSARSTSAWCATPRSRS
jgi:hypothetical protein